MRRAELIMALVLAVFSVYLMWKSAELPIGWIPGKGPGGGAFPFWLAAGMFGCCVWIVVRWIRRSSPVSNSTEHYMKADMRGTVIVVAGSLLAMIGFIHIIGVYFSVPLFLLFYMRFLGAHRWSTSLSIGLLTPVVAFFFFEIALRITLPKGYTEPLFYPLYDWFM